jgi:phage terminase large subunit-like protein
VYDLTVDEAHEFVANGIIVHNCDEVASWSDAWAGSADDTTWSNLVLGCRLGKNPQVVVTTTPKPVRLLRGTFKEPGLLDQPGTVVTRASTYENLDNLAPSFKARVLEKYEGTRLGRQELHAEMLDDSPGALWRAEWLERNRVHPEHPGGGYTGDLVRVVVAVDPAPGVGPQSDETGIIVAGLGLDGHAYVLEDATTEATATADEWAARAVKAWIDHRADALVAESNNGADLVRSVIRHHNAFAPIQLVYASRGKQTRAEPIAQLYEQGRVHHAGSFNALEDQLLTWDPEDTRQKSPDRLDALCWAIWSLIPPVGEASGEMRDMRLRVGTHRR